MKILHVSNLRSNRRWYRWLSDHAPRHDLLVIAGNLVDHQLPDSLGSQRRWVLDWLRDDSRPVCVASGPEDREFDAQANMWRPARWLREAESAMCCVDDGFIHLDGLAIHSIGWGDSPSDRFADIHVTHRMLNSQRQSVDQHERCGSVSVPSIASKPHGARAVLFGEAGDPDRWQQIEHGTLYLNPGWRVGVAFPDHVVFDPVKMAALRVQETNYIPRVEVFGGRSIVRTLGECHEPAVLELGR